jgi:uncharacterized protein
MVIADTGFWLALTNSKDPDHAQATDVLRRLDESLITTWPVVTETCYLLLKRHGPWFPRRFLEDLASGALQVFDLQPEHGRQISRLMESYADLPMDLADASLVILAEDLGHGRILSTDRRDFGVYRWKQHEPFENLLLG